MLRPSPQTDGPGDDVESAQQAPVQLSRLEADVLGMLGHDLAGPLTVIIAASETLLAVLDKGPDGAAHDLDRAAVRKGLEAVQRQARRLEGIRADVLAAAAADAGAIASVAARVTLLPILRASADLTPPGITLTIDCEPDVSCLVQPSHLSQMVSNLVSNAVRYADRTVSLSAVQILNRVVITVSDDGPGVPVDVVERLFTRFSHAGAAARPVGVGTGLGLYIVRTLADANRGTVHHSPSASGTRFTLTIPAAGTSA